MNTLTDKRFHARSSRLAVVVCALGVLCLSLLALPRGLRAETPAGAAGLSDAQKATLTAGIAEKKSYIVLIAQARKDGVPVAAVVAFLCTKADNAPAAVDEIVYAAITGGSDAAEIVAAAVRAGGPLGTVVQAALAAGADRQAVREGAKNGGATPEEIANALAGLPSGGQGGGSPLAAGPGGGLGGGTGGSLGGGAGGTQNASPHKRQ